jgi:hypothetical protein
MVGIETNRLACHFPSLQRNHPTRALPYFFICAYNTNMPQYFIPTFAIPVGYAFSTYTHNQDVPKIVLNLDMLRYS